MTAPDATVQLIGTQSVIVHSTTMDDDYELAVALPDSYHGGSERYPTLLVLDSPGFFGFARLMASTQHYDGRLPEMIVVGIGRPDTDLDLWDHIRVRDYAPVVLTDQPGSGRAVEFLDVLDQELLPVVHAQLRTDPTDTTLWGHSLGGTFVLSVLTQRPDLVERYIATSPAVTLGDQRLLDPPDALALSRPTPLFVSVGADDSDFRPGIESYLKALRQAGHHNLELQTAVFADAGHTVASILGLLYGIQAVRS